MVNKRIRSWYAVYRMTHNEPSFMVSAVSIRAVNQWLSGIPAKYKILPVKVWLFAKVFSGEPVMLEGVDKLAPNDWFMLNEGITYHVVILT